MSRGLGSKPPNPPDPAIFVPFDSGPISTSVSPSSPGICLVKHLGNSHLVFEGQLCGPTGWGPSSCGRHSRDHPCPSSPPHHLPARKSSSATPMPTQPSTGALGFHTTCDFRFSCLSPSAVAKSALSCPSTLLWLAGPAPSLHFDERYFSEIRVYVKV